MGTGTTGRGPSTLRTRTRRRPRCRHPPPPNPARTASQSPPVSPPPPQLRRRANGLDGCCAITWEAGARATTRPRPPPTATVVPTPPAPRPAQPTTASSCPTHGAGKGRLACRWPCWQGPTTPLPNPPPSHPPWVSRHHGMARFQIFFFPFCYCFSFTFLIFVPCTSITKWLFPLVCLIAPYFDSCLPKSLYRLV